MEKPHSLKNQGGLKSFSATVCAPDKPQAISEAKRSMSVDYPDENIDNFILKEVFKIK